jgi:hypothetical protein
MMLSFDLLSLLLGNTEMKMRPHISLRNFEFFQANRLLTHVLEQPQPFTKEQGHDVNMEFVHESCIT